MAPVESSSQGGVKLMIMEDRLDARIALAEQKLLHQLSTQDKSPSSVTDVQEFTVKDDSPIKDNLTISKKISALEASVNRTRRSQSSSGDCEHIAVNGHLTFNKANKLWTFKGKWIYNVDKAKSSRALQFNYNFTQETDKEPEHKLPPTITSWSGYFMNPLKRTSKDGERVQRVRESFDMKLLHGSIAGECVAEAKGRNKFGTFTLRGTIIDGVFVGVKEYYKLQADIDTAGALRRSSREVRQSQRLRVPTIPDTPTVTSPKARTQIEVTRLRVPRQVEPARTARKSTAKAPRVSKKRPREAMQSGSEPTIIADKKARGRKKIKDFVRSVVAYAEEKSQGRRKGFSEILGDPRVPSKRSSGVLKLCEKQRKLIANWNSIPGQFATPFAQYVENGEVFKPLNPVTQPKRKGYGVCAFVSGYVYEGEWNGGKMNGRGVITDGHGAIGYQGEFQENRFHGVGTAFLANGDTYDGEWRDNHMYGFGWYQAAGGTSYIGQWCQSRRNGYGSALFIDGSNYHGEWHNDLMHGKGTLVVLGLLKYDGMFNHGLFDGRGVCEFENGAKYEGTFKQGLKDGRGRYTFPNGAVHEGRFRNDKVDGTGFLKMIADKPVVLSEDNVIIPIDCQSEMRYIHLKAGFGEDGS